MLNSRNRFQLLVTLLGLILFLSGCTHALHQYHAGEVEKIRKGSNVERVKSEAEQFVVMGFVTETDYVNVAYNKLKEKCSDGRVTGIHTRYSTSHGFFSWTNKVRMVGHCIR